jgi:hypothetical protein
VDISSFMMTIFQIFPFLTLNPKFFCLFVFCLIYKYKRFQVEDFHFAFIPLK